MSAMVVVDTLGAIAIGGEQAFTWLAVLFVTFFIPSALASAELGAAIPEEGGAYVWVRMAFGRLTGALTSLLYWAGTPVWLGGSVTVVAIAVWERFFVDFEAGMLRLRDGLRAGCDGGGGGTAAVRQVGAVERGDRADRAAGRVHVSVGVTASSTESTASPWAISHPTRPSSSPSRRCALQLRRHRATGGGRARRWSIPRRDIPVAILRAGIAQALMYGDPDLAILFVLPRGRSRRCTV